MVNGISGIKEHTGEERWMVVDELDLKLAL